MTQLLARTIPVLTDVRESKLSKHTIVEESLKYHRLQQKQLEDLRHSINILTAERDALATEVNAWRRYLSTPSNDEEAQERSTVITQYHGTQSENASGHTDSGEGGMAYSSRTGPLCSMEPAIVPPRTPSWSLSQEHNCQLNMPFSNVHVPATRSLGMLPELDLANMQFSTGILSSDCHVLPGKTTYRSTTVEEPYEDVSIHATNPVVFEEKVGPGTWDHLLQAFGDTAFWPPSESTLPMNTHLGTSIPDFLLENR